MTTFVYASSVIANSIMDNNTQGTEDVSVEDDGEPKPMERDSFWIQEMGRGPRLNISGKWMLFYLNQNINAAWIKAKTLLRKGNIKSYVSCLVLSLRLLVSCFSSPFFFFLLLPFFQSHSWICSISLFSTHYPAISPNSTVPKLISQSTLHSSLFRSANGDRRYEGVLWWSP